MANLTLSWRRRLAALTAVAAASVRFGQSVRTQSGVIHVNTTKPGIDPTDGYCSLQEAIYSANFDDNKAPTSFNPVVLEPTECEKGNGDAE